MAIKSHISTTIPTRDRFKREITLISKGYAAPAAFPDGKITVFPWDIQISEWLQKRARKGNADTIMFDLLPQIANLNGCPVEDFVMTEVMLIAMVSRSILRENKLDLQLVCPACNHEWSEPLQVPEQLGVLGEKGDGFVPGSDKTILPVSLDEVATKPLLVSSYKAAAGYAKKTQISERLAVIIASIVSVGGGEPDSAQEVLSYINALHPKDLAELEKGIHDNNPQLDPNLAVSCPACGHQFHKAINFDAEFFRSGVAE